MFIRPAHLGDEHAILGLIRELAVFEKAPAEVIMTAKQLSIDLFEDFVCQALVVEKDSEIIGFALYYTSYSTWKGRCLYLEDFYIQPAFRGKGFGSMLFDEVVSIAKSKGVKRMDWQVLDWNVEAIRFYTKKGALLDPEWVNGRLFFEK